MKKRNLTILSVLFLTLVVSFLFGKNTVFACSATSECATGEICWTIKAGGPYVCLQDCSKGEVCPAGFVCDLLSSGTAKAPSGACEPTVSAPAAGVSAGTAVSKSEWPPANSIPLTNPLGGELGKEQGQTDIGSIVSGVITKILGVIGILTLVVFLFGGFTWLTSAGSAEKVKKGTDAMLWAVVGLFVIFGAYAIIKLVFTGLGVQ